jgi:Na+/H+ antiporter NhaA
LRKNRNCSIKFSSLKLPLASLSTDHSNKQACGLFSLLLFTFAFFLGVLAFIFLLNASMNEKDQVGILLDAAALPQVGKLGFVCHSPLWSSAEL